nr:SpoIIE family protein phosphatase [Motilibacter deserti]
MTGRGLALVDAVSAAWGVERDPDGGKLVWAELEAGTTHSPEEAVDIDELLAAWHDDEPSAEQRYTVVLGDVPTDLLIAAKAHIDNVVRELSLARDASGAEAVPEHLALLIETVVEGFADARDAIKRQALAAAQRAEPRTLLTLHLPPSAADAGEAYLAALDEADTYSRAARLLTLETPPAHRLFRRWYVEAVVRQVRELAAGNRPEPVTPFETRLLDEVQRLAALQRASDRAARLQRVTAALAVTRTPEDVADVVVSEGVAALGASGGGLLLPSADGDHLTVPGVVGYAEDLVDALREERLDAPLPAATALRTGQAVWLESQDERDSTFPALRGFEGATVSMCAVPLIVGDRTLGALRFSFTTRRLFDKDERSFVLALAAQTAQTLLRTEVYAAEREAALELQRALLPAGLAAIRDWDIAAYYSPAGGQEAGGDFYDVLPLPDGRVVAVVGDVMGRGVQAAAAMAQTRTVIRAYAIDDPEPAAVLSRVDAFFETLDGGQLVTVLYLLLDPQEGTAQIASAGHLAPLHVRDGHGSAVDVRGGTPFGVTDGARRSVPVTLAPGDALVLVTDGLVERRGEDIDVGFARVTAAVTGNLSGGADALLRQALRAGTAEASADDDVTILVLRRESYAD